MGISKYIVFFLLTFILFSCYTENKPPHDKPQTFLSEKEMVEILTDIQLAEGVLVYHRQKLADPSDQCKDSLFQAVFDHYGISGEVLRENINYYNTNPKLMEKLYEKVLTNLSKKQSEITIIATKIDAAKKAVMQAAEQAMKEKEEDSLIKETDTIS